MRMPHVRALVLAGIASAAITPAGVHAAEAIAGVGPARAVQEGKQSPGRTVWDGVYREEQADRGRALYMNVCASCHAKDLRGDSTAPSLVDESFAFQWDDTTVSELFVRIRTLMPSDRPNSLPDTSYRDIVAFLLQANKFPPGEMDLDADADALGRILITSKRPATKR